MAVSATIAAVGLVMALASSPARGGGADYDYDPSVDFTELHTFRWLGDAPSAAPRRAQARPEANAKLSPLVEKQIGEAVRTQLEAKGLRYQEGPADLLVAFHTGKQRDVVGYGWGPHHVGPRRVVVYQEGVLTIDLVKRDARELVWRGSTSATIKQDPEKLHKQIETLVEKILKNYPPKTSS
jgi:hypothetical protein